MYSRLLNIFHFNKVFWWIICILIVSNIVFFAAVRGRQKNRITELHELYKAKRSAPALKNNNDQAPFLQAEDDIKTFLNALPESKNFSETAAELLSILKKNQIDAGQTVYKPESVDLNGLYKYSTSLNIKGSYKSLKTVLADIQESRSLFCIETLSISGKPDEGSLDMKLKIATYFR